MYGHVWHSRRGLGRALWTRASLARDQGRAGLRLPAGELFDG